MAARTECRLAPAQTARMPKEAEEGAEEEVAPKGGAKGREEADRPPRSHHGARQKTRRLSKATGGWKARRRAD